MSSSFAAEFWLCFSILAFDRLISMLYWTSGLSGIGGIYSEAAYCSTESFSACYLLRLLVPFEERWESNNLMLRTVFCIQASSEPGAIRRWACLLRLPTFLRRLFCFFTAWSSPCCVPDSFRSWRSSSSYSMLSLGMIRGGSSGTSSSSL